MVSDVPTLEAQLEEERKTRGYIAFALTGDVTADAQTAAYRIRDECNRLREQVAELERKNAALKALIACNSGTTDREIVGNFKKFLRSAGRAPALDDEG